MIDVTSIVMNFHQFLIALVKALRFIDYDKGSEAWEELTEDGFRALVVDPIKEKFAYSLNSEYEFWLQRKSDNSLIVKVITGSRVLVARKEKDSSRLIYNYSEVAKLESDVELSFIEFGHPGLTYPQELMDSISYVQGVDSEGKVFCARVEYCKFLIEK